MVSNDRRVTAHDVFDRLSETTVRHFRTRFDAWLDWKVNPKWYHGWDSSEFGGQYTKCFVFKCKENKNQRRLYGFLCNPKISNKNYQVCVLVCHAFKNEHETDRSDLKTVEEIRTLFLVQETIKNFFRENADGSPLDRKKH